MMQAELSKFEPKEPTEPIEKLRTRTKGQKSEILSLLSSNERVSVSTISKIAGQYNARINELNKDLAKKGYIIESEYDPDYGFWYKKLINIEEQNINMIGHPNTPRGGGGVKKSPPSVSHSAPASSSINTRAKGNRFEREVKKLLEKMGYFVVRQSNSQFPDLIAISPSKIIYFIECKVRKYLSNEERETLRNQCYGLPYVAYPVYHGREKDIEFEEVI